MCRAGREGRGKETGVKIYLNAQFADGRHRTRLLSAGMCSEYGEFYRIASDTDGIEHARRNPWLREHVLSRLPYQEDGRDWHWDQDHPEYDRLARRDRLAGDLLDFTDAHPDPEFWAWQGAWAYTCIRRLFGRITDRPAGFPAWCGELAAVHVLAGKPALPSRGERGLHALEQARWARDTDQFLNRELMRLHTEQGA
jgi:hypothetical protein